MPDLAFHLAHAQHFQDPHIGLLQRGDGLLRRPNFPKIPVHARSTPSGSRDNNLDSHRQLQSKHPGEDGTEVLNLVRARRHSEHQLLQRHFALEGLLQNVFKRLTTWWTYLSRCVIRIVQTRLGYGGSHPLLQVRSGHTRLPSPLPHRCLHIRLCPLSLSRLCHSRITTPLLQSLRLKKSSISFWSNCQLRQLQLLICSQQNRGAAGQRTCVRVSKKKHVSRHLKTGASSPRSEYRKQLLTTMLPSQRTQSLPHFIRLVN